MMGLNEETGPDLPEADPFVAEPLADLLSNLVVIMMVALALLLVQRPAPRAPEAPPAARLAASAEGVRFGPEARLVPLAALRDDAALAEALAQWRRAGQRPVLVVAADGLETGFLLEGLIARQGFAEFRIIRQPR